MAVGIFALCNTIGAFAAEAPENIIRDLYKEYIPGDINPDRSALEKIRPFASKTLQQAIDMEHRCQARSKEICAIDFDYIIAGQDWGKLNNFRIERTKSHNGLNLLVHFSEQDVEPSQHVVAYFFVKENNAWRIDDVNDDKNGLSLKAAITRYFKEFDENNNSRRK
jgi:hypothetical protein